MASHGRDLLASMGIYLFNRNFLVKVLRESTHEDFGRQIFPSLIAPNHVQVHLFDGYWEDIGTIEAFYNANLALASRTPPFHLSLPEAPIYSRARFLPPSQFDQANIRHSLIADGCFVGDGATIENSVVGLRCIIGRHVTIRNSVIMGADEYETLRELEDDQQHHRPPVGIGDGTRIEDAIVDKNCRIGQNVWIANPHGVSNLLEKDGVSIREGIPVVCKDSVLADGWSYANWVVGAARIRDVDENWPAEGSRIHHSVGAWPLMISDTTSVESVSPPAELVLKVRAWPAGEGRVRVTAVPEGAWTRVAIEEGATSGPAIGILKPIRDLLLKWRNDEALRRLAYLAENRERTLAPSASS